MAAERDSRPILRAIAIGLAAGCLLSHKLWTGDRSYPLLPVLPLPEFGLFPLLIFAISVLSLLALPLSKPLIPLILGSAAWLVVSDQTRLQPWFYIYLLLLCALALRSPRALRIVMISCYAWSGLQKLSVFFPLTIEPYVQAALGALVSTDLIDRLSPMLLSIPAIEALLGLGLCCARTRKLCVVGLICMHVFILLMIGPTGRAYNSVVWPWNVFMIFALLALFWRAPEAQRWKSHDALFLAIAGLLPLLGFFGFWDAYPSWALYAPRYHELQISVPADGGDRIPRDLQPFFSPGAHAQLESSAFRWSMAEMNVPPYAERRVMLQLADRLCQRAELIPLLHFRLLSPPARLSGFRESVDFSCGAAFLSARNRALLPR